MAGTEVLLFLAGDVMTGRGVDQILPHPSPPALREPFVTDARDYVQLAEQASGAISRPVDPAYVWGDALAEWERHAPALRIVNLETSVTRSDDYAPDKGIHYRMHPDNIACLTAARFDVCVLANNHVLDFGRAGLRETLETLEGAGITCAGAGRDAAEASRPVRLTLPGGGRLLLTASAHPSSGVPLDWAPGEHTPGVDLLADLSDETAERLAARVASNKQAGDIAIVSIHWGGNWGYEIPHGHVEFAHRLVEHGVDIVYGHSSHHPRPIEVYRERLILYGCGDFLNDYEGIAGYESYRDDLVLMYFPSLDAAGRLATLRMTPLQIRRMRLHRPSPEDVQWLATTLNRVSEPFGSRIDVGPDSALVLREASGASGA